jgi:hypothetical protein
MNTQVQGVLHNALLLRIGLQGLPTRRQPKETFPTHSCCSRLPHHRTGADADVLALELREPRDDVADERPRWRDVGRRELDLVPAGCVQDAGELLLRAAQGAIGRRPRAS